MFSGETEKNILTISNASNRINFFIFIHLTLIDIQQINN